MKRLGRTLPFLVAALLTFQGLTAMAAQPTAVSTGGGPAVSAATDRQALVREILGLWESAPDPVVGDNATLHGDLRAALKGATVNQLLDARQARTYEDVWAALPKDAGKPGTAVPLAAGRTITPLVLGDSTDDLVFTPVTPCRIIDTRAGVAPYTGIIAANTGRQFYVSLADSSPQGGFAGSCGIPTSPYPSAVAINITSTGQVGTTGNLRAIQTCGGTPNVSLVNYVVGTNIANAAIVPAAHNACGFNGDIYIYSGNSQSHAVVDIMGYFNPPAATPLSYTRVSNTASCAISASCYVSATCPAGTTVSGGGFQAQYFAAGMDFVLSNPQSNGWTIAVQNNSAFVQNVTAWAACSWVPGH
jgi:hypothetical protein